MTSHFSGADGSARCKGGCAPPPQLIRVFARQDMGVTIHYEGRLRGEEALGRVIAAARAFAAGEGWRVETIQEDEVTLQRVRAEQDWDYTGPTRGVAVYPHEDCESFRLEFDRDLYLQEFVKTQFAPLEVHLKLVTLLRSITREFEDLRVEDEGEFWETGDRDILVAHLQACARVLEDILKSQPGARGPVRLPSGRIVDYMTP